jgi:hypothetical protein
MLTYQSVWIITAAITGFLVGALITGLWASWRTRQRMEDLVLTPEATMASPLCTNTLQEGWRFTHMATGAFGIVAETAGR